MKLFGGLYKIDMHVKAVKHSPRDLECSHPTTSYGPIILVELTMFLHLKIHWTK